MQRAINLKMKLVEINRLKILIVSAVNPFLLDSGQALRVNYTLKALCAKFDLTLLLLDNNGKSNFNLNGINNIEIIKIESIYSRSSFFYKWIIRFAGLCYSVATGLKFSNFLLNFVEFNPKRISRLININNYQLVLFEYWHPIKFAKFAKKSGLLTIVDTHNVLWQTYKEQMKATFLPKYIKNYYFLKYKKFEENLAFLNFEIVVAINLEEKKYFESLFKNTKKVIYCPMGSDITMWPFQDKSYSNGYSIFYYGGLSSKHNSSSAIFLAKNIKKFCLI